MKGTGRNTRILAKSLAAIAPSLLFLIALELVCLWWEKRDPPSIELPQLPLEFAAKKPDEIRLLFYGGSTVAGQPLPELGFRKQMQYYFSRGVDARADRHFTLANFGMVSASSTYVIYRMEQTLRKSEGDVAVVMTAHNEFLSNTDLVRDEYAQLLAIREQFFRFALLRRAQRYVNRYYLARRPEFVQGRELQPFDRTSERFRQRIELFRDNIETIVDMTRAVGMPLVLCTMPSNVRDWPPSRSGGGFVYSDTSYANVLREMHRGLQAGASERVRDASRALLADRSDDALAMYYLGKAQWALSEGEEAAQWLQRAKESDPFPFRALDELNDIVRAQRGRDGVFVVDIDAEFKRAAEGGLPGLELFADNCHPSPMGNFLIARALIEELRSMGLVEDSEHPKVADMDNFLRATGAQDPALQVRYYLENARYAMKPPFFNFAGARWNLKEALKRDKKNWHVWANMATISLLDGDVATGRQELTKAYQLRGQRFDLDDRSAHPLLREALEQAGLQVE